MKYLTRTERDLILSAHKLWLESDGKDGKQADLANAQLTTEMWAEADLRGANLSGANLSEADLAGAKLSGANLENTKR